MFLTGKFVLCIMDLGGYGSMQHTPTGCMSHLPTILRTFKKHSKSTSVNIFVKCSDLIYQPDLICQYSDRSICNIGTQITKIWIYILDVISNVNIRIDSFATLVPELPKSEIYISIFWI